jgi:hypothetical protein
MALPQYTLNPLWCQLIMFSMMRKIICADDTFEIREVVTPLGKANNLNFGNTFLWD